MFYWAALFFFNPVNSYSLETNLVRKIDTSSSLIKVAFMDYIPDECMHSINSLEIKEHLQLVKDKVNKS